MITKFKIFENKFDYEDVVVAKESDDDLIQGHYYIVTEDDGEYIRIKDIVNNRPLISSFNKNRFMTPDEWENREIYKRANKYNL